MRLIDEQHTACPFYGSRRMTAWLTQQGEPVNRKRVQRLDRKSTRLNSSHLGISYAVFCLKKKILRLRLPGTGGAQDSSCPPRCGLLRYRLERVTPPVRGRAPDRLAGPGDPRLLQEHIRRA